MSVYKVPQDVEAEDKLLGPLTLKQFIFAIVTILLGYIAFTVGRANLLLMLPFIPPMALFGYLAAPFQRDQPTDVYLGARLRFLFKPRKRIWDQSGIQELVRITVPKKVVVQLTNNLNQSEVESRLSILASTIDSRGWATKNAYVNETDAATSMLAPESDRLVDASSIPQNVPETDITAADDMLDPSNNRLAHHMDQLAAQAANQVHQQAIAQMQQMTNAPAPQVVHPQALMQDDTAAEFMGAEGTPSRRTTLDDRPVSRRLNPSSARYNPYPDAMRQHVLRPVGDARSSDRPAPSRQNQTTEELPQSAKLGLAQRDDLSVDTIAREADRVVHGDGDEVVINLH